MRQSFSQRVWPGHISACVMLRVFPRQMPKIGNIKREETVFTAATLRPHFRYVRISGWLTAVTQLLHWRIGNCQFSIDNYPLL